MKKAILFIAATCLVACAFAQQEPSAPLTKTDYLKKSKRLWHAAIITVSAGGALAITGIIVGNHTDNYNENGNTGSVLFITGCAVMLSSLVFSIPAHINKKRAMSMSFKNEPFPQFQKQWVYQGYLPSLNVTIGLKKLSIAALPRQTF